MVTKFSLVAFRDTHGMNPLVFGQERALDRGIEIMFCSKIEALHKLGFIKVICDVMPEWEKSFELK